MPFLLAEVPISIIESPSGQDSLADRYIFDHLVYYFSKFDTLPAITLLIEGSHPKVTRGSVYLEAARTLRRPTIRAVLTGPDTAVRAFLSRNEVEELDWSFIQAADEQESISGRPPWHVFFFQRPLTDAQIRRFLELMRDLHNDRLLHITYNQHGPCAEFQARVPMDNPDWAARSLSELRKFSQTESPIISYQGSRFA